MTVYSLKLIVQMIVVLWNKQRLILKAKVAIAYFSWCTRAIDGIAIRIKALPSDEMQNQNRFYSGNKKAHCLYLQVNRFFSYYSCWLHTHRLFLIPIALFSQCQANLLDPQTTTMHFNIEICMNCVNRREFNTKRVN